MPSTCFLHASLLATCALTALLSPKLAQAQIAAATPIALTGYNADVVTEANTATRYAQSFDVQSRSFFEAGARDDSGVVHNDGLHAGNFTSSVLDPVTHANTIFQLQPFNGSNDLLMQRSTIGTLALVAPTSYTSLSFLAGSGDSNGTDGIVNAQFILNFSDGTSSGPISLIAYDWGRALNNPNAAISGLGRNTNFGPNGTGFTYEKLNGFSLFETDVDLTKLGLSSKPIASITFTASANAAQTSVLAISGFGSSASAPEPSPIGLILAIFAVAGAARFRKLIIASGKAED